MVLTLLSETTIRLAISLLLGMQDGGRECSTVPTLSTEGQSVS